MKKYIPQLLTSFFAIFVGAQIAEGALMVPHWQSMEPEYFYKYYNEFGPFIGRFFTILTIAAAAIPITLFAIKFRESSKTRWYALCSSLLILLCIVIFFFYFKDANELFYEGNLTSEALKSSLEEWSRWHWIRVALEICSLVFLILAFNKSGE